MPATLAARCLRTVLFVALLIGWPLPAPAATDSLVVEAFEAGDQGQWERAFRLIRQANQPLATKTLRWVALVEDAPGIGDSFPVIARFVLENPAWPVPQQLRVRAEESIVDPADHTLVRRYFKAQPPLTARGRIRLAEALFEVGADGPAIELLRMAWTTGIFSETEERSFLTRHGRQLRKSDHIARLDQLLWTDQRTAALRMLKRVPDGERRLAEARLRLQQRKPGVEGAIAAVPARLRDDPGLVFDRLRWRRHKGQSEGVVEILLDPPAELGQPERWWAERERALRDALDRRDYRLAYRLARAHGQREGRAFAEAEWLAGWLALRFREQPKVALAHFAELYEGVESNARRPRAAYWAGRAAAAMGDQTTAASWYRRAAADPLAYYGQLAAQELDWAPARALPPAPGPAARALFKRDELVKATRLLLTASADQPLRLLTRALAERAQDGSEIGLLADLFAQARRPDLVATLGRYAVYLGKPHEAAAFPIPQLTGLISPPKGYPDPALLLGVTRQESMFDSASQSHAGARGLMQLIPQTAKLMARGLGMPYNAGLLVAKPDYNVRLGSEYLRRMLERYGGEPVLALAAYNAGPSRVDRWLGEHGDPRGDRYALVDWVELIPFDETRNYVQRVLEGATVYQRRLADAEVAMIEFPGGKGALKAPPLPAPRPVSLAEADKAQVPVPRARTGASRSQAMPGDNPPVHLPRLKPRPLAEVQAAVEPRSPEALPARVRPVLAPDDAEAAAEMIEVVVPGRAALVADEGRQAAPGEW